VINLIEFEVVLDRPWDTERTIRLRLDKYELIPLGCEDELDYLFKEISPARLKQVVRTAIPNEEFYVSGVYITVIK
jgi:hypothetical protein